MGTVVLTRCSESTARTRSASCDVRASSAESSTAATPAGSFRSGTEASAPRLVSTALAGSFVRRLGEKRAATAAAAAAADGADDGAPVPPPPLPRAPSSRSFLRGKSFLRERSTSEDATKQAQEEARIAELRNGYLQHRSRSRQVLLGDEEGAKAAAEAAKAAEEAALSPSRSTSRPGLLRSSSSLRGLSKRGSSTSLISTGTSKSLASEASAPNLSSEGSVLGGLGAALRRTPSGRFAPISSSSDLTASDEPSAGALASSSLSSSIHRGGGFEAIAEGRESRMSSLSPSGELPPAISPRITAETELGVLEESSEAPNG